MSFPHPFDLTGRVAIVTGGAGLLGEQHCRIIARAGGIPVIVDVDGERASRLATNLAAESKVDAFAAPADICDRQAVETVLRKVLERFGRVDILVNNAANNPQVAQTAEVNFSRFEKFPLQQWLDDLAVGLTGAFLCSQVIGQVMAEKGSGVIVNIASDLGLIGPDQRLYRQDGLPEHLQPAKPVSYSVTKSGLLGLTRYLATYWAEKGIRVNSICPGGIENGQPEAFVKKLSSLIPLSRMAAVDEYQGALLFLCSDASSYMTGANLVVDGGRTCW